MKTNSAEYWNDRYLKEDTPWDIGYGSPMLLEYVQSNFGNKDIKILIPGGGRAYEMSQLYQLGYHNVYLCDWSEKAIEEAKVCNPEVPEDHFLWCNFFEIEEAFDLILEQTFFCALPPALRADYAKKVRELLQEKGGWLVGLFFDREFEHEGPPFGGQVEDYKKLFSPFFKIQSFEWAENSIKPREGTERFLIAQVK